MAVIFHYLCSFFLHIHKENDEWTDRRKSMLHARNHILPGDHILALISSFIFRYKSILFFFANNFKERTKVVFIALITMMLKCGKIPFLAKYGSLLYVYRYIYRHKPSLLCRVIAKISLAYSLFPSNGTLACEKKRERLHLCLYEFLIVTV